MTRKPAPAKLPTGVYPSGKSHYQYRLPLPRDPDTGKRRQEVRGGFQSPEEAFLARAQRLAQLGRGAVPDQRRLLGDYLAGYLDAHSLNVDPPTIWNYRITARLHILPELGDVPLANLTPERVRGWVAALARSKSNNTAKEARRVLVQVLNQAVIDGLVPRNVAALVKPPRVKPKPRVMLDSGQIARFLAAADDDEHAAAWYLALLCQLRPGELAGLRWADVDMERGMLHVTNTRSRGEHGGWVLGDGTKTDAGQRDIPMPGVCVDKLREHRRRQVVHRLALPPGYWEDLDLVCPNRNGRVLNNSTMERRLDKLCERAGVPRITPHGLRHAGLSLLAAMGANPRAIAGRAGHKDVNFTFNTYVHTGAEAQQELSRSLDALTRKLREDAS